ncbi:hypothetical protein SCUCBS95973_003686 [Sporothrix curviconia]|uniref:Uncharacterized protein n=1 Tax=Sporothrix curviconia TaxID=1260050 RepID=A0ABP0BHH5_9PEZI
MHPALKIPQPVIWINGWPAVGKSAVAQCLCQFLGQDRAIIIDDCEFTDSMKLSTGAQMARHTSRATCGRARGLSVDDMNKPGQPYGGIGGHGSSSAAAAGLKKCPDKECSGKDCLNKDCPSFSSKTSVVRECVGGRLIADDDELSLALRARQEACFRKYVLDMEDDDEASGPVAKPSMPGLLKPKLSKFLALREQRLQSVVPVANMQKYIIFTDCRADDAAGAEGAWRYAHVAKQANRPFIPIYVECLPAEHERRSMNSDRVYSQVDGAPITGAEAARELQALSNGRLFTFPSDEIPGLFVDVTSRGTHPLVMEILSFINTVVDKRTSAAIETTAASARRRPAGSYDETPE